VTIVLEQMGRKSAPIWSLVVGERLFRQAQKRKLLHFGAFSPLFAHKLSHEELFEGFCNQTTLKAVALAPLVQ
jgi:ribosomal protein S16